MSLIELQLAAHERQQVLTPARSTRAVQNHFVDEYDPTVGLLLVWSTSVFLLYRYNDCSARQNTSTDRAPSGRPLD